METEKIDVPKFDGFECIGVLRPTETFGDIYILDSRGHELAHVNEFCSDDIGWAQLCYRKIKPKRITFERVGEWTPKKGEYFMNKNGYLDMCTCSFIGDHAHEIYRIVEDQS